MNFKFYELYSEQQNQKDLGYTAFNSDKSI